MSKSKPHKKPKTLSDVPEVAHLPDKLYRAKEHIAQLERELAIFENEAPYGPIVNDDPQRAKSFLDLWQNRRIPPRFSIIAGEVIYQLRSSLDHIHQALIRRDGGTRTTQTQFPIWTFKPVTPKELRRYQAQVNGITRRKVLAAIKRHQPYTRRTRLDGKQWLGIMNMMGNTDKHHAPISIVGVVDARLTQSKKLSNRFTLTEDVRDDGAPLAVPLPMGGDFVEVTHVERRLAPYVAFKEFGKAPYPQPLAPVLSQLADAVNGILAELVAFL
jgi:hypothetical protein